MGRPLTLLPGSPETTANGSVIRWDRMRFTDRARGRRAVPVLCGRCDNERLVDTSNLPPQNRRPFTGYCTRCRGRRGPEHPRWKGGRRTDRDGYIILYVPEDHPFAAMRDKNRRCFEHRLVMAQVLGRCLKPTEHVHHLNRVCDDNRPENLEVVTGKIHWVITQLEQQVDLLESVLRRHGLPVP